MAIESLTKPKAPAGAKPFTFDRSFDRGAAKKPMTKEAEAKAKLAAAEAPPPEPEPPPPPSFSEEELQAAKAAAWEEGREAGLAEARAEQEAEIARAMQSLSGDIAQAFENSMAELAALEAACLELAERTFTRLMPVLAEEHGDAEILAVLKNALEMMLSTDAITLRLSPERADQLGDKLEETARMAGFEGRMRILPDPSFGPSDISVDWGDGRADRRLGDALQVVDDAVAAARSRAEQKAGVMALSAPVADDEKEA